MDRQATTQCLLSLLPTLPSSSPPTELLALANSLLVQSRSAAPALKPEEEIARCYVCAHIACEQLKTRLDLPDIVPRPPCAKRLYNKTYAYVDKALENARTPGKKRDNLTTAVMRAEHVHSSPGTPGSTRRRARKRVADQGAHSPTPTTRARLAGTGGGAVGGAATSSLPPSASRLATTLRRSSKMRKPSEDDLPNWLMPLVRHLCLVSPARSKLPAPSPSYAPHIFTAVATLASSTLMAHDFAVTAQAASLVSLAVAVTYVSRMHAVAQTPTARNMAQHVRILCRAAYEYAQGQQQQIPAVSTMEEKGAMEQLVQEAERYMELAEEEKWTEMEWYTNMALVAQQQAKFAQDGGDEISFPEDDDGEDDDGILVVNAKRGGEMAMYAADWSHQRWKKEYASWEKSIRDRIKQRKRRKPREK